MKLARSLMAAAFALATMGAISAPALAASKSVTTRSNGACTTKVVKVREGGMMRTRTVRNCRPVVRVAPRVVVRTPVVSSRVVVRQPVVHSRVVVRKPMTHKCVTKTVVDHGVRRSRKVCT